MKKLTKKLLSLATALSLSVSAMAFTMTASAEEYNGKEYDMKMENYKGFSIIFYNSICFVGENVLTNLNVLAEKPVYDIYGSLKVNSIFSENDNESLVINVMAGAKFEADKIDISNVTINDYSGKAVVPDGTAVNNLSTVINPDNKNNHSNIQVNATAIPAPEYVVSIPRNIDFGECVKKVKTAEDKIKATNFDFYYLAANLGENEKRLDIKISSDFKIANGDNFLDYTIVDGEGNQIKNGETFLTVSGETENNGFQQKLLNFTAQLDQSKITEQDADYTGTVNFTVSLTDEEV